MVQRRNLLLATGCLFAATAAAAARAQSTAPRPMRLVVPFPPGGTTDILARELAHVLAESRGAAVVVENKGGAGGIIGSAEVARAAPDGTTLLLTATHHVINPSLLRDRLPYDARRDFTPLALIATVPNALVVHPSLPVHSVAELIAHARANPGRLSFGSTGIGGANHLAGELFKVMAGIDIVHVPYRGAAPAMSDLLGGQIPMMFDSLPTVLPHLAAGRLRALAVTSAQRAASAPDLPTMQEAGVHGFEATAWFGLYGPGGMPAALADRINGEVREALAVATVRERFARLGAEPGAMDRSSFAAFVLSEMEKWREVVERAKVRVE